MKEDEERRYFPALTLLICSIAIGGLAYYQFRLKRVDLPDASQGEALEVVIWSVLYFGAVITSWGCLVVLVIRAIMFVFRALFRVAAERGPEVVAKGMETGQKLRADLTDAMAKFDDSPRRRTQLEEAYATAANELENGVVAPGLWAKAFADSEGDEQKRQALYLRYRAEQIVRKANKSKL